MRAAEALRACEELGGFSGGPPEQTNPATSKRGACRAGLGSAFIEWQSRPNAAEEFRTDERLEVLLLDRGHVCGFGRDLVALDQVFQRVVERLHADRLADLHGGDDLVGLFVADHGGDVGGPLRDRRARNPLGPSLAAVRGPAEWR